MVDAIPAADFRAYKVYSPDSYATIARDKPATRRSYREELKAHMLAE